MVGGVCGQTGRHAPNHVILAYHGANVDVTHQPLHMEDSVVRGTEENVKSVMNIDVLVSNSMVRYVSTNVIYMCFLMSNSTDMKILTQV